MRLSGSALRAVAAAALLIGLCLAPSSSATADPTAPRTGHGDWVWPLSGFRLERPFVAPAHRYGPGHRGLDIRAGPQSAVQAPAGGRIAFSGSVAGRGILTIDHGDGLVTTLEPVVSELSPGDAVEAGEEVATLTVGGHSDPGALHFGVRLDGEYINPLLLLDSVPRAVLLPCC